MTAADHQNGESVRDVEHIRHVNETISQDDSYRAQTEASNIQIVTPHYKSGERPGSELRTGASAAELNARFAETNGDYKAERSQEHFRMQIIDPKVASNAHLPAHAPREFARKKLIEDFPSLHSKRSFLDLDALEQRTQRKAKPISISKYLADSVDRHQPKKDDFRDLDKLKQSLDALQKAASQPKNNYASTTVKTQSTEELDELARLGREIAQRSRSGRVEYKVEPQEIKATEKVDGMETFSQQRAESYRNSTIIRLEEPPPAPPVVRTIVRHEPPPRHEVVEIRRESKPKVTQNVQRFEERKRTEEVERRVIRRERRHKSSRIRYGHHSSGQHHYGGSGGAHNEFHDWNKRGLRSSSAASRNGYGGDGGGEYYYHSSSRHGGGGGGDDRFFNRGTEQARYGDSISDSLRRGDLKYGPNGDVRENGHHAHHNGNASEKYSSSRRVHKSYSTRDVHGGGGASGYGYGTHQPIVEFPPTLPRHGASYQNGYGTPAPPPHRQNGHNSEYYYSGSGGAGYGSGGGRLMKSRSYADWGDGGRGPFGSGVRRYDDDMARLENEFRDSLLMKLPTNGGNMNEKDFRHEQIPGGYETYEREVKASSGRKHHPNGVPTDFKESSHGYNFKRETQR